MNTPFTSCDEGEISRAIIENYMKELHDLTENDVIIVGSGPAGTIAAKTLAENGVKTTIIERNIKPGGGMYLGGMLMNKMVVEAPAHEILEENGVTNLIEYKPGMFVGDAYAISTKLLSNAFESGAKMLNAIQVEDVIAKEPEGVCGVVINWHAISALPSWITCVDPLSLKAKIVIDATGHAAEVTRVASKKLGFELKPMEGPMWVDEAEKGTIEATQEIYPGLIVTGMAANGVYGIPRMGPIFGAMFLSGIKAAEIAMQKLKVIPKKDPVFITQKK